MYLTFLMAFIMGMSRPDTIPFTMTGSRIYFTGVLNGQQEVRIQFDLGAGIQCVNKNVAAKLPLQFDSEIQVSNSQGQSVVRKSDHNELTIGPLHFSDLPFAEVGNMQAGEDLIIGNGLFQHKIIEIDYDRQIMIIQDQLPAKIKGYTNQPVIYEQNRPKFQVTFYHNQEAFQCWCLFDTGRDGTMLIGEDFTGQNSNWEKLQELKFVNGRKIVCLDAEIGGHCFTDIVTNAADPAKPAGKGTLFGNQVLNQFNVILDNQEGRIYLKENGKMGGAYSNLKNL